MRRPHPLSTRTHPLFPSPTLFPSANDAGGRAGVAHLPPEAREVTDSLASLGNTTAAVAKGFAVGSAALTALVLFKAFEASLLVENHVLDVNVGQVEVF